MKRGIRKTALHCIILNLHLLHERYTIQWPNSKECPNDKSSIVEDDDSASNDDVIDVFVIINSTKSIEVSPEGKELRRCEGADVQLKFKSMQNLDHTGQEKVGKSSARKKEDQMIDKNEDI